MNNHTVLSYPLIYLASKCVLYISPFYYTFFQHFKMHFLVLYIPDGAENSAINEHVNGNGNKCHCNNKILMWIQKKKIMNDIPTILRSYKYYEPIPVQIKLKSLRTMENWYLLCFSLPFSWALVGNVGCIDSILLPNYSHIFTKLFFFPCKNFLLYDDIDVLHI